jgi:hypothetical protein
MDGAKKADYQKRRSCRNKMVTYFCGCQQYESSSVMGAGKLKVKA